MGVRGLETFIERDRYGCNKVVISEAVARYKAQTTEPAVIVVDACSCLLRFYRPLPWVPGGQMKEYEAIVEKFVNQFRSIGVELVFFFDGPLRDNKVGTWIQRKTDAVERVNRLFDNIKAGLSVRDIENMDDRMMLVDNNDRLTIDVLKRLGCKVFNSILECDLEIVKYASENACMAILGQDSDFLVYPGAWRYWSSKHFDLNLMTTREYGRQRLEECLGIPRQLLPLWASLMGNDVLSYNDLQEFHNYLRNIGYRGHRAFQVARYVSEHCRSRHDDPVSIIRNEFPNSSISRLLEESVKSYEINEIDSPGSNRPSGRDIWDKISEIVMEKHKNNEFPFLIYGIVALQNYKMWECKEDYSNEDLPPNQQVLKKLRQKTYGILLHEKPLSEGGNHVVNELAVAGPGTFDRFDPVEAIPPCVPHPGLLSLWTGRGEQDNQWNLFCSSFGVDPSKIRGVVPDVYVVPVLSLLYLLEENVKIQKWEAEAVVASFVLLSSYSIEKLERLPVSQVDPRALHLYTLVTRSFATVYTLNVVCGCPVPLEKTYFSLYQDGKLFHVKYHEAQNGAHSSDLCELKSPAEETFHLIMNLLPSWKFIT